MKTVSERHSGRHENSDSAFLEPETTGGLFHFCVSWDMPSAAGNVSHRMRRDSLVVGLVLVGLSLFLGWGYLRWSYFILMLECMGYLPIPPSGLHPGYCGSPTPPYYMSAIFATLILAGLVLITWSIIGPPKPRKTAAKRRKLVSRRYIRA